MYPKIDPSSFSNEEDRKNVSQWEQFFFSGKTYPNDLIADIIYESLAYDVSMSLSEKKLIKRDPSKDVRVLTLPLYLDQLYKYLENLKTKFPQKLDGYSDQETKDTIVEVTNYAEKVFAQWNRLLKDEGASPSPTVTELWNEYKASKAKVGF